MYEIVDLLLDYGIPIIFAILMCLSFLWESKIRRYLNLNYPDIYRKINVAKQDETRDDEEWTLFSEFIGEKHADLNDTALSEIIFEYKIFRFSSFMVVLLFIAHLVILRLKL